MSAERLVRGTLVWGFVALGGIALAEEAEAPDLEFLEYLGSWENAEEDWILLAGDMKPAAASDQKDDKSVDAPGGEKLAELNDESE